MMGWPSTPNTGVVAGTVFMAFAGTALMAVDGFVAEGEAGFGCISKAATEVTPTAWPIIARFAFLLRHTSRPPTERPMARTRNIGTLTLTPMIHESSDGGPSDSPWGLEAKRGSEHTRQP